MDADRLRSSPVGRLVTIRGHDPRFGEDYECEAFLPDPLPAEFHLAAETFRAIVDAAAAVARADQTAALLPNPLLLARPAIRREAVSTSALEGTYAALAEVFEAEFLDQAQLSPSVGEVHNYVRAAEQAYAWVQEGRPITRQLIESLQATLVAGTASETTHRRGREG